MNQPGHKHSKNKRHHGRFEVLHAEVGVEKPGLLSFSKTKQTPFSVVNVSETGIQFIGTKYYEKGHKFDLSIKCPAFLHLLICRAEVVWCRRTSQRRGFYRVGARFTKMTKEAKTEIHRMAADPLLRQLTKGSSYIG